MCAKDGTEFDCFSTWRWFGVGFLNWFYIPYCERERERERERETCTAKVPTAPLASVMRIFGGTLSFLPLSGTPAQSRTLWRAENAASPKQAPSIAVTPNGLLAVVEMCANAYSANPPPDCIPSNDPCITGSWMQSKNVVCKKLSDASNTQHFEFVSITLWNCQRSLEDHGKVHSQ